MDEEAVRTDNNDPLADLEEKRVLSAALDSFWQYRRAAHYNITHLRRQSFYSLPAAQIELLSSPPFSIPKTFDAVDKAIDANADIADAILAIGIPSFGLHPQDETWKGTAGPHDLDKARSTIRQLYRDWSAEGCPERAASFSPILTALGEYLPKVSPAQRHHQRVLVPGAGLGRLVFEICAAGYDVEGNEISYHQLLASNYILNSVGDVGMHALYPWALNFSNHHTRDNQLQRVAIPDVQPAATLMAAQAETQSEKPYSERMAMTSGDFCVLYRETAYIDTFDAVATCFFIDTAPNVISYIETILSCLKRGGLWINLGPLLWHFESAPTPAERDKQRGRVPSQHAHSHGNDGIGEPGSIELSNDEVIAVVERHGFEMLEHRSVGGTGYIQDSASMLQNVYRPMFWVAKKL
ncbi:related to putative trehalase [Ramularia collo-cygni]|uniref:carnosine N-methyltransferase n=1 Tax=Ramularia collo-cygni TaxID=112498 RepID=A0A2D3VKH4_9PEZI|nr:related to putative trehalase [Ramularia collo-cygni]CZT23919.1 related to putative trehalase [Ramularia collo-cygni]